MTQKQVFTSEQAEKIIYTADEEGFFRVRTDKRRMEVAKNVADILLYSNEKEQAAIEALLFDTREARKAAKASREKAEAEPDSRPLTSSMESLHEVEQKLGKGKFLLTVAQNNTDVDATALAILQNYAKRNDAQILVARMTYNKNAFQQGLTEESTEDTYYDPELAQYMADGLIDLGGVLFFASANVIPTARNPLSGFEAAGNGRHVIVPASKMALQCVPALKGRAVRQLWATGSITKRNYIVRKAGAVASLEHNIGAVFVDTTGETPIIRNLEVMQGNDCIYDASGRYDANGNLSFGARPMVFQPGDIHAEKMTKENLQRLADIISDYYPKALMLHDVLDFEARNHHNRKNPAFLFGQSAQGNSVAKNLQRVQTVIEILAQRADSVHVVKSNHDDALTRWLDESDYRIDPENALTYLEIQAARFRAIQEGRDYDPLRDCQEYPENVTFHALDESIIIAGVEHGEHGHNGANGARGSVQGFRKLGVPMNTGHTHSPSICGGVYTAGVSASLEMGYNVGASSWAIAHVVTWPNGQRQVIFA